MTSADEFRRVLRHFASGVTIVTTRVDGKTHGMTVSAFTSVSAEPPLIAVVINKCCTLCSLMEKASGFAVNILTREQQEFSERFAFQCKEDRFLMGDWTTVATGAPLLRDALAWLECRPVGRHPAGSHVIFIGAVEATRVNRPGEKPLIYWNREYWHPSHHPETIACWPDGS